LRDRRLQLFRRSGELCGLKIGEREVDPDWNIGGLFLQGLLVLHDGVFIMSGTGKGGAEIGAGHDAAGSLFEIGPVFADRAFDVAGLVQLDCVPEDVLGG
jgi:hypothetical protein